DDAFLTEVRHGSIPKTPDSCDLGFYISFSGILTFKNASDLREVARFVPLDRMLIETDSPYLAPMPHRGKTNNPSFVPLVAQQIAELTQQPIQTIAEATSRNFDQLFSGVNSGAKS
ncbi:MAG: TatD family hydrolase, partial [Polaromonas sp.]